MHYAIINEICTNKPHRLRRAEAMGGNGGQKFITRLTSEKYDIYLA